MIALMFRTVEMVVVKSVIVSIAFFELKWIVNGGFGGHNADEWKDREEPHLVGDRKGEETPFPGVVSDAVKPGGIYSK